MDEIETIALSAKGYSLNESDDAKYDIVTVGMHVGTYNNSHNIRFSKEGAQQAIDRIDGSILGSDGHSEGSSYEIAAIAWNRIEIGEEIESPRWWQGQSGILLW